VRGSLSGLDDAFALLMSALTADLSYVFPDGMSTTGSRNTKCVMGHVNDNGSSTTTTGADASDTLSAPTLLLFFEASGKAALAKSRDAI